MANVTGTEITVQLDIPNKEIIVTDVTDYAGQSINVAWIRGILNVYIDGNLVYAGTGAPDDIDGNVDPSMVNQNTITLPLDPATDDHPQGVLKKGTYTVEYLGTCDDGVNPATPFFISRSVTISTDSPVVAINLAQNCGAGTLTSDDATVYTVSGVSIAILGRTHTLYWPPVTGFADIVTPNAQNVATNIYTGTWTSEVISSIDITYNTVFSALDTISGHKEFEVNCDDAICTIMCCIKKALEQMNDNCGNLAARQEIYNKVVQPLMLHLMNFIFLERCGKTDEAAVVLDKIKVLIGCEGDCCDESTSTSVPVIPSVGNITVVNNTDGNLVVTSNTVGDTTTYTVNLAQVVVDFINNSFNTLVAIDPGSTSFLGLVDSGVVGGVRTYTLSWLGGPTGVNPQGSVRLAIQKNGAYVDASTPITLLTEQSITKAGGNIVTTAWTYVMGESTPEPQPTDLALIKVSNFLTDGTKPFIVHANCNRGRLYGSTAALKAPDTHSLEAEVFWVDVDTPNDEFWIRLVDPQDGRVLTWEEIFPDTAGESIYIAITVYNNPS